MLCATRETATKQTLGVAVLFPGRSVRAQTIPLQFTNVPAGRSITDQSTDMVQVWLRGSDFAFETAGLQDIIPRCDLTAARVGLNQIPSSGAILDVPFGVRVERIAPKQISVRLVASTQTPPPR